MLVVLKYSNIVSVFQRRMLINNEDLSNNEIQLHITNAVGYWLTEQQKKEMQPKSNMRIE